jgi:hypothetical protein
VDARRITPAMAGAVAAAFVIGGIVAVVMERFIGQDTGTVQGAETVLEAPVATVETVPSGPLTVVANTIQLPTGYESTTLNNGPTFTFVDVGRVEVTSGDLTSVYASGAFFYQEEGRVYTLRVLNEAQLSIVRLLPPGEQPTTTVG